MIIYNNRERGPLEYDKFILNTFQNLNMVNYYTKRIKDDDITELIESINNKYNSILEKSEKVYYRFLLTSV